MIKLTDFDDPFDAVEEFEKQVGDYTGAKGVIATDSCTHAIELGLRLKKPNMYATLPAHTYLSLPMMLMKLDIDYMIDEDSAEWDTRYRIGGSYIYDCAREFEKDMFDGIGMLCLSFGHGKPLDIGHGGAILINERPAYHKLRKMSYDGRDRKKFPNWGDQKEFELGFHYHMRPEDAVIGLNKLANNEINPMKSPGYKDYPSIEDITINDE